MFESAGPPQSVGCTTCGSKTQVRTCGANCTWGAWADTSACTWCEECAEVVYCDAPGDRGAWCRQLACSPQQADGDCEEDIKTVCGAKTKPFFMEYK